MNDLQFEFNSPMTKEDWEKLADNEMEDTEIVTFNTLSGKRVPFRKVKHGEWKTDREEIVVRYGDEYEVHIPYCSECGWKRSNVYEYLGPGKVKWNFCPECGADMRGETE